MIQNKRAMSTIVTTVIMVALVLIAVGVVWAVINNVINQGTQDIDLRSDCLKITVESASPTSCTGSDCTVYLERKAGGKDIAGIKVIFKNSTESGAVLDYSGNIEQLATVSQNYPNVGVVNPTTVEITAYFENDLGEAQI